MEITVHDTLESLPADCRKQAAFAVQGRLFQSLEWFDCLLAHGTPPEVRPRLYLARDGAMGCLLVCGCDRPGGTLASLSTFYTMSFGPVALPPDAEAGRLIDRLIAFIAHERPAWRKVELRMLQQTSDLEAALVANGFAVNRFFQFDNQFVPTSGTSFADYYVARPSRLKNTVARREKKLRAAHQVELQIYDHCDETGLSLYLAVYAQSWKQPERYPDFIPALCRLAGRLGILRLGTLLVDDAPAAAQIWLLDGKTALIYKLAYDERYKDFSVGSILTKALAEHVLTHDRVEEIDYGHGSEPYKRDWMTQCREVCGLEAFNQRSLAGRALYWRWRLGRLVKTHLGSVVPRDGAKDS